MDSIITIPEEAYGTGWKLDTNVLYPSITTYLAQLAKNTNTTKIKPPHFTSYEEEDIEDIKLESARLNQEEFDRVWGNYQRAWDEWVRLENEAGRIIEVDPSLPWCDSPRIKNHDKFFEYLMARILRIVVVDFDLKEARLKKPGHQKGGEASVPTHPNVMGPALIVDKHGEVFAVVLPCGRQLFKFGLPDFIPGPLREDEDVVLSAVKSFQKTRPAVVEQKDETKTEGTPMETKERKSKVDYRYPEGSWKDGCEVFYDAKGLRSKPLHFGCWPVNGHKHDSTNTQYGPRNCIPTDASTGGSGKQEDASPSAKRRNTVFEYQKAVLEAETSCGAVFKAVDPNGFEKARQHREELVKHHMLLRYSELQNNPVNVAIFNAVSDFHRDEEDASECWAQTTTSGWYRDGAHVNNVLGEKAILSYRMRPGTIVMTKAQIIPHGITGFEGERYCNLFTAKSDSNVRQNVAFEEDEEEKRITLEKQGVINEKKAKKKAYNRNKEQALLEKYKTTTNAFDENDVESEEYYKLVHVQDFPPKLKVAQTVKNKKVKEAKQMGKSKEMLEELLQKPASLFYSFGIEEQKRYDNGEVPFKKVHEVKKGFHTIYKDFLDSVKARQEVLDSPPTARKRTISSVGN